MLDAFPAQRFIRVRAVSKPRPLHQANRNAERRKDDLKFWLAMNRRAIGGFGVPWGPWGFNSGMDVEDIGRDESDQLGLTKPDERLQPVEKDLNDQSPGEHGRTRFSARQLAGSGFRRSGAIRRRSSVLEHPRG